MGSSGVIIYRSGLLLNHNPSEPGGSASQHPPYLRGPGDWSLRQNQGAIGNRVDTSLARAAASGCRRLDCCVERAMKSRTGPAIAGGLLLAAGLAVVPLTAQQN